MPDDYLKGTLQFMALALLEAVKRKKPLEHTPSHDLESIIYVLGYTVLRHVVSSSEKTSKSSSSLASARKLSRISLLSKITASRYRGGIHMTART